MSITGFPEDKKINLMLVVPMLHQGGFERVCVKTARLLAPLYNVTIAVFDLSDAAFDLEGLHVEELGIGAADSRIAKIEHRFPTASAPPQVLRTVLPARGTGLSSESAAIWTSIIRGGSV